MRICRNCQAKRRVLCCLRSAKRRFLWVTISVYRNGESKLEIRLSYSQIISSDHVRSVITASNDEGIYIASNRAFSGAQHCFPISPLRMTKSSHVHLDFQPTVLHNHGQRDRRLLRFPLRDELSNIYSLSPSHCFDFHSFRSN